MNQKETTPLFPINPDSSILDGISVDEIFKYKKKQWQEARKQGKTPRKTESDTMYPKQDKSQP